MTTVALASPQRRNVASHIALASFWFGLNFHWVPILAILVPSQVSQLLPRGSQGGGIGIITAMGGVLATLVPPLVGHFSDRLTTPWGRRRPIMVVGVAGNVVGLIIMMLAPTFPVMLAGYLVIQLFNNAAGAAFNALVPDVVPAPQFGRASGILGVMVQLGSVAGLVTVLVVSKLLGQITYTYGVMAIVLVLTLVPTLYAAAGEGQVPLPRPEPTTFLQGARDFLRPLTGGDFAWVIGTRMLITAGIYTVLPFLLFFFRDVVGASKPADYTAFWELVLLLAATPFGLAGGWLSDRLGRKPFVYASGAAQGLVLLVFILLYPTQQGLVLLLGGLYGVGYGLYYAVDWALACDTLPDSSRTAKDMGLFHSALTIPQVLLPAIFGPVLDALNHQSRNSGYRVVFSFAILFYLLGTLLVSRVRSIR